MMNLAEMMRLGPVVPVLTIDDPGIAVPLARALVAGGLPMLEVTLRTPAALEALARMAEAVPDAVVGAGTVIRPEQFAEVRAAGARFVVSPGHSPALLAAARGAGLPFLPGVATASEVIALLEAGITHMKFFPAESAGGAGLLKSLSAPLPEAKFCPTGGIDAAKAVTYLALPNVLCVGGSWVTPADALAARDWDRIEALARDAARLGRR